MKRRSAGRTKTSWFDGLTMKSAKALHAKFMFR
jgi:hypothetical protein